jgi:hypothetical protein
MNAKINLSSTIYNVKVTIGGMGGGTGSGQYIGKADTLAALQLAYPTGIYGDYAIIDSGTGSNAQLAIFDADGNKWVLSSEVTTIQTITLLSANWVANAQTITVTGVTTSNVILLAPTDTAENQAAYLDNKIKCTAQNTNSLTFTNVTTPTTNISVIVVIIGSSATGGGGGGTGQDGRGISDESYNPTTGILTLTFTDATTYSTGDLRGTNGIDGDAGVNGRGIASESYNPSTGILTLTFTDNTTYATGDLRGATGATGASGNQTLATFYVDTNSPIVEGDIYTMTVAANKMANDGDQITFNFGMALAANSNARIGKVWVAGTACNSKNTSVTGTWDAKGTFIRTGTTTGRVNAFITGTTYTDLTGLDYTQPIIIKFTGSGVAIGDIVGKYGNVIYIPKP